MSFPQTPIDVSVELNLDGTWTDLPEYAYDRDGISITRGRADEASQVDPSTCSLTLNNRDGRFSPRNPTGPYYGALGRNTPVRVAVNEGAPFAALPGTSGNVVRGTDAATLDITGDIDIILEFSIDEVDASLPTMLISKYAATSNQRSWALWRKTDGSYNFQWSTDGTNTKNATSTAGRWHQGRQALWVCMDVDNGLGQSIVTFFSGPTVDGPWEIIGDPVVRSETTSIFSSTANVLIGANSDVTSSVGLSGSVYRFQLRNGIGSSATVVANPDFTVQTIGSTSFSDTAGTPVTWTMLGDSEITNKQYRFHGEVSAWPQRWDLSGNDVYTPIEASGILRRLGQGSSPLRSVLVREFSFRSDVVAHWPCEDSRGTQLIGATSPSVKPGVIVGSADFESDSSYAASGELPLMNDARFSFTVPSYATSTESATFFLARFPDTASIDQDRRLFVQTMTGTAATWELKTNSVGLLFTLSAKDTSGASILSTTLQAPPIGQNLVFVLKLAQSGSDISYTLQFYDLAYGRPGAPDRDSSTTGTLTGQTVGKVKNIALAPDRNLDDVVMGQLAVSRAADGLDDLDLVLYAYESERAADRMSRLCAEEGVSFVRHGFSDTQTMGPQGQDSFLTIINECALADGGMLFEPRHRFALGYRDRQALYCQSPGIELVHDEGNIAGVLEPVEDDRDLRNDSTVARKGGSFARATKTSGPLSIEEPPGGVGLYDESVEQNLELDSQLPDAAGWRLHLGTIDEERYPSIELNLAHSTFSDPDTMTDALLLDQGSRIEITNLPSWLPPGDVSQMTQGYTERFDNFSYRVSFNCSPESPYQVGRVGAESFGVAGTSGSLLNGAITSTATTISVATTDGPLWTTDASDFPFDILVGGERMTVENDADGVVDTFTRSTSNGWGTSDSGDVWATSGGSASDYSVNGSTGLVSLGSVNVRRFVVTPAGGNISIYDSITVPVMASGGSISGGYVARYTDDNNFYLYQILHDTSGTIDLEIVKRVAGTFTVLGSANNILSYSPGTPTHVQCLCADNKLAVKIWRDGTSEPDAYQLEATDSSFTTGKVGTHSNLVSGNTNTLPVVVSYDNINVVASGVSGTSSPQTFTVTRSVNGVVKSHPGTEVVTLFEPMILGL